MKRDALRALLVVASVAVLGCGRRTSARISADPTSLADAAPGRPTVSFTQATIAENDGVEVSLSWPILILPADRVEKAAHAPDALTQPLVADTWKAGP